MKKIAIFGLLSAAVLGADLAGLKVRLDYDGGVSYDVDYKDAKALKWTNLGDKTSGDEAYAFDEIAAGIYAVSWVEIDGTSVTQVLNLNENKVRAAITFANQKERGGREQLILNGKITKK